MDIATVAAGVTTALVPALPFLVKAGEKGMETLGEKVGEGISATAQALWRKLWPAVKANPTATAAVEDVAAAPDDADFQAALRAQIKKIAGGRFIATCRVGASAGSGRPSPASGQLR
ncbi:hypothetical protein E4P82_20280 [Candidatus Competibacter phosphatis]|uniref:DUF937 domain-containing protein n=1 Tax=Candidatus Competibacter phosphatis TaxID=221280 RepID=A0ABX1TRM5_9GAMM|nr:hypothetical protein [Candidatus Competibacter phosphatis]NMQ21331.1 hypothetical protein [Candidatus Competibacter phosphatis]